MANFEGLIRQALASQDASDPATRQKIYRSSRNALAKMLEKSGKTSDDIVRAQFGRLEQSIASIEAEYRPAENAAPQADTAPVAEPPPTSPSAPEPVAEAPATPPAPATPEVSQPTQAIQAETIPQKPETPPAREQSRIDQILNVPEQPVPEFTPPPAPAPAPVQQPASTPSPDVALPPDYQPEPLFPSVEPASAQPPATMPEPVQANASQASATPSAPTPDIPVPASPIPDIPSPDIVAEAPAPAAAPSPAPENPVEAYLDDMEAVSEPANIDSASLQEGVQVEDFAAERELPPTYKRKHPLLRRIWPIFIALAVLAVVLWILYALFATRTADTPNEAPQANVGEAAQGEDGSTFITLLQPTDLSSLVTAGRGTAELVTQQRQQMLRIKSVRQNTAASGNAEPILLELERGVLRQINGKEVTVEFYTKSGGTGPAQFSIQCDIGGDSVCGRKRFRIGLQPERILFKLDLTGGIATDARAYLAINTDITNSAETTGNGDAIDIIHVRLRLNEEAS